MYFNFELITRQNSETQSFHIWTEVTLASFVVGCLMGGLLMNRVGGSGTRSLKEKVKAIRCTLFWVFFVSLVGSVLLFFATKVGLSEGYLETCAFVI